MSKTAKLIIIIVLVAAVAGVAMLKKSAKSTKVIVTEVNKPDPAVKANLPRLVDLGADKCIPCKMMAPVLEDLKTNYKDKLAVEFIDVWKNPTQGGKYNIRVIPTQIFYDSSGKELFRHEGFFAKDEIIAKWKEFGVDLDEQK